MTRYIVELRAPKKGEVLVAGSGTIVEAKHDYESSVYPVIIAEVPDDCVVVGRTEVCTAVTACNTLLYEATAARLRAALDSQKTAGVCEAGLWLLCRRCNDRQ